jgi:hypothetical protein
MNKNYRTLLKTVADKTEELRKKGLKIKAIESIIWPILEKYRPQIDKGDVYGALLEIGKIS